MLRIGSFEFAFPVVQAALAGYSDAPMRLIAREAGAPYALQEVVLDRSLINSKTLRQKWLSLPENDHPLGGQIMGADAREMAAAAELMVDAGCEVIDLNFGCPVKKVLRRYRGGYLLSEPATAIGMMHAVREAVPPSVPVTIKVRRGLDDTAESERAFFEIVDAACELGVAAITLHPRYVTQRYRGNADWEFLARVRRHLEGRTLLGSGDLFCADDIRRMMELTGVDGVTVARGCIGNPWIFSAARAVLSGNAEPEPPTVAEQGRVIRRHFAFIVEKYGPNLGGRVQRKFGIKYADLHPCRRAVRAAFVAVHRPEQVTAVLDEWYDPARDWPPGRRKGDPGALEEWSEA